MNNQLEQNIKSEYANKIEQVDASIRFVLMHEKAYYESQISLPEKVKAAILVMIAEWMEPSGYHFRVLKQALIQYRTVGVLTHSETPFTHEQLYPEMY